MAISKLTSGLAAAALVAASLSVCSAPADAASSCTITSQGQSNLKYNVSAGTYCANGYRFRAVQKYVNNAGSTLPAYGEWKSVGTSSAARPTGTLYYSGSYQIG